LLSLIESQQQLGDQSLCKDHRDEAVLAELHKRLASLKEQQDSARDPSELFQSILQLEHLVS
jgi:hypothetical protein